MEKYLKIHWLIRLILSIITTILVVLIMSNIYGLIYFSGAKETLSLLGINTLQFVSTPIILVLLIIQLGAIYVIYSLFNYRRWAILFITIFIGLPLFIISIGGIGFIAFGFIKVGLDIIRQDELIFFIVFVSIIILFLSTTKINIELIRLYKNIKIIDQVAIKLIRNTKPKFLNVFLISMIPVGILGIMMIVFYNPVISLDLPEGYLKREDFDLDNPVYTDQKICKKFDSEIEKYKDFAGISSKDNSSSGVLIAKKALYAPSNTKLLLDSAMMSFLQYDSYKEMMEKISTIHPTAYAKLLLDQENGNKSRTELATYIQENPEQWKTDLRMLRSELSDESVLHLQNITEALPNIYRCNIRNDNNISSEFFPSLTGHLHVSRVFKHAIQLAILENDPDKAIDILRSFHDYENKILNSQDMSLVGSMINMAMLGIQFQAAENTIENSTPEQIEKIREIYKTPYDIKKTQINAWKGEYYHFEHVITNRTLTVDQLSIPYIFNGKDMINRGIILVYAGMIAESKDDTTMMQKISENKILNNENFLTPTERNFLEEGIPTWKGDNVFFGRFYNPIGKMLVEALVPSLTGYHKRYRNIEIYQEYIRHDLLGIEQK